MSAPGAYQLQYKDEWLYDLILIVLTAMVLIAFWVGYMTGKRQGARAQLEAICKDKQAQLLIEACDAERR